MYFLTFHTNQEQDYAEFLQILDANKNGTIEEEEFLRIIEERAGLPDDIEAQEESYRSAFRVFDRDESGKISADELRYLKRSPLINEMSNVCQKIVVFCLLFLLSNLN